MYEAEKQKLELLQARKKKAESLPLDQQIKWKKEIDKINREIAEIKNRIGLSEFDEDSAFQYLLQETKNLGQALCSDKWQVDIPELFEEHPEIKAHLDNASDAVDEAYRLRDMAFFKQKVKEYTEAFLLVEEAVNVKATTGFIMVMPEEKDAQVKMFK